ncbi:PhzF family phenazine biosynthesis protein [Azohydromonas caseinilytica]|uniref:PhzF family phenazine biosynthesis protein n=1 Tax=Azohydromonas caseinilytica TaxID=2728836 RepID=A0A848FKH8_9BURK|nr:PhzF family phenazine biosynthesis protein [Azohydromonas caseinilytica]NML18301.1 PhzF family phenazine biosynthesis protein [Azohydromonas caseinilytica]
MPSTPFKQVDVFTAVPFRGNPVAVVLQAEGLDTEAMQRIARWTNLSETTFVLPPTDGQAHYRVRIFTPGAELPFAGHPTLGTAHALLEAGVIVPRDGELVQECGAGLVRLQVAHGEGGSCWIAFELPQPVVTPLDEAQVAELEAVLGQRVQRGEAAPRLIDVGARWITAQLADAQAVAACRPDLARMAAQDRAARATGVTICGLHAPGAPAQVEVRSFAPAHGIGEDPVCGSGNGCVAVLLRDSGQLRRFGTGYIAAQGAALGREGRVRIEVEGARIRVGGQAVTGIDGHMAL